MRPVGESLRLIVPETGQMLPIPMEAYQGWAQAEAARAQAEMRVRELEAELKKLQ